MSGQPTTDLFESLQLLRFNEKTAGHQNTMLIDSTTRLNLPSGTSGIAAIPEEVKMSQECNANADALVGSLGRLCLESQHMVLAPPFVIAAPMNTNTMDVDITAADAEALALSRSFLELVAPRPVVPVVAAAVEAQWPPKRGVSARAWRQANIPDTPVTLKRKPCDSPADTPPAKKKPAPRKSTLPPRVRSRTSFPDSDEDFDAMELDGRDEESDDEALALFGLKRRPRRF